MIAPTSALGKPTCSRSCAVPRSASRPSRKIVCNAAATAWDAWDGYVGRRTPVKQPAADEQKLFAAIGQSISAAANGYQPKFASASSDQGSRVAAASAIPLSSDLHKKLEAIGLSELRAALGLASGASLDVASNSFTTTDVNAGILITGCIVQQGADKIAKVAFVASETERQASWSRLEGLLLHWACASAPGDTWHMPPVGWKSIMPGKSADAGGAIQCAFEKKSQPGSQEQAYVLVMEVPISGILRSGGITFVLKASDAQNTKWLKDAGSQKDFFVDIQSLPYARV